MRGIWPLARLCDQPIGQHALERAIERAGAHLHLILAVLFDLLHDLVAVLLAGGEREQDVEHRRGERDQRLSCLHAPIICPLRTYVKGEDSYQIAVSCWRIAQRWAGETCLA